MGLNDEVDEEFGRPSDEPVTIAQPENGAESDNDVRDEDIFTKGIKPRRIPQLEAEFVIQKSREDRLVQLGEKTHEISTAGGISISTQAKAQDVLLATDSMLKVVDGKRAELGAVQNRLDSTIRNQANISENVSAARSRIRDADFATETANMTKQNILQQAASSILAQANQRPQSALSLLQG